MHICNAQSESKERTRRSYATRKQSSPSREWMGNIIPDKRAEMFQPLLGASSGDGSFGSSSARVHERTCARRPLSKLEHGYHLHRQPATWYLFLHCNPHTYSSHAVNFSFSPVIILVRRAFQIEYLSCRSLPPTCSSCTITASSPFL